MKKDVKQRIETEYAWYLNTFNGNSGEIPDSLDTWLLHNYIAEGARFAHDDLSFYQNPIEKDMDEAYRLLFRSNRMQYRKDSSSYTAHRRMNYKPFIDAKNYFEAFQKGDFYIAYHIMNKYHNHTDWVEYNEFMAIVKDLMISSL